MSTSFPPSPRLPPSLKVRRSSAARQAAALRLTDRVKRDEDAPLILRSEATKNLPRGAEGRSFAALRMTGAEGRDPSAFGAAARQRRFASPSRLLKKGPRRGCERRGLECKTPRLGRVRPHRLGASTKQSGLRRRNLLVARVLPFARCKGPAPSLVELERRAVLRAIGKTRDTPPGFVFQQPARSPGRRSASEDPCAATDRSPAPSATARRRSTKRASCRPAA